jgi:Zn-dependent protease
MAILHLETPKYSYADGSFAIGSFERAPIRVHAGFLLAAGVLTLPYWLMGKLSGIVLVAIGVVTVFVSVFLHELGHASVGHSHGVAARRIDLHLFGGTVEFHNRPRLMQEDFAIIIAGPLANLALAAFAYAMLMWIGAARPGTLGHGGPFAPSAIYGTGIPARALAFALYLNLGLFVVNMLPGYPLDGGKLLFMLIARRWNGRIATWVVGGFGVVLSLVSFLVLLATAISGWPIWSPPNFQENWEAIKAARGGTIYSR